MQRRSSGSSEGSAGASVKTSHARPHFPCKKPASPSRQSHNSPQAASTARNRLPTNQLNWQQARESDGANGKESMASAAAKTSGDIDTSAGRTPTSKLRSRQFIPRSPWAISVWTLFTSITGIALLVSIVYSSTNLQCDPKGCRMSWMSPSFIHFSDFDTEHTRLASKYSLYLYREQGIDNGPKVRGIPVLFIPGNAGSYKQVRSIASESARYFHEALQPNIAAVKSGIKGLDFFTVDFNEDFTAFHGQTMLDQAEYVNEAIRYILSLYLDPQTVDRDPNLPDPSSVIVLGHSMGGIVARAAFVMPNFQPRSINTIVTMSAPHARPPVTFDPLIVKIYQNINDHWRLAYSENSTTGNPLSDVTLVSIAGGGLDTVVPSDYASLESIVPETHGFTVFTSTIPTVWTSMDHQAITWCDQFRKVIVRAFYDIVNCHDKAQTKTRAERIQHFKKRFLTGLEAKSQMGFAQTNLNTLLTVDGDSDNIYAQDHFELRGFGSGRAAKAYLLPIQSSELPSSRIFTLLSNSELSSGEGAKLEVLVCSIYPLQASQSNIQFLEELDFSDGSSTSTPLACKNVAPDVVALPASTHYSKAPFFLEGEQQIPHFSYLQFDGEEIRDYQFVAIVDKSNTPTPGWLLAQFVNTVDSHMKRHTTISQLITTGLRFELPADRPMVMDIQIPAIQNSLLAYHMKVEEKISDQESELFRPLIRQYLTKPYESKFFVDAKAVDINFHGVSPFVPPPLNSNQKDDGLGLQIWTDPNRKSHLSIELTVDPIGSLGKLYMRYRTVFASFPQLVVGLVLRKQFRIYDSTGTFVSFPESLGNCIRRSLPMLLLSMTFLSLSIGQSGSASRQAIWPWRSDNFPMDFAQNDLLVGTTDPFFWFLIPIIGIVCIGVCVIMHYIAFALISMLSIMYGLVFDSRQRIEEKKTMPSASKSPQRQIFIYSSPQRRLLMTSVLLFLVSTIIPYQSAYAVACLVQLSTSVRAHYVARGNPSLANINFRNYVYTIFLLMVWNLPINLPTMVVWLRNLSINWLTPFSSLHNVLSILPFILLVGNLAAGDMIPPVTSWLRHLTNVLFFATAVYAAIYGVSYAYVLHYLVNLIVAWLVAIHSTAKPWDFVGMKSLLVNDPSKKSNSKQSKKP